MPQQDRLNSSQASMAESELELAIVNEFVPELVPRSSVTQDYQRHEFTYEQWVDLLRQEAIAMQTLNPDNLAVLVGDSISLWFPPELLPRDRTWLNQGISGETSEGLLQRIHLLDQTNPRLILVMIGINDLIHGQSAEAVVGNIHRIVRHLVQAHPDAAIVIQSILPHSAELATWEGKARLKALPNSRIQAVNQDLAAIADAYRQDNISTNVFYLDLYPLFADADGRLSLAFTTDGLHLSDQGYLVWRTAMQVYSQLKLKANAA